MSPWRHWCLPPPLSRPLLRLVLSSLSSPPLPPPSLVFSLRRLIPHNLLRRTFVFLCHFTLSASSFPLPSPPPFSDQSEGHIGLDNRLYALDFGRVMPPEALTNERQSGRGLFLFRFTSFPLSLLFSLIISLTRSFSLFLPLYHSFSLPSPLLISRTNTFTFPFSFPLLLPHPQKSSTTSSVPPS